MGTNHEGPVAGAPACPEATQRLRDAQAGMSLAEVMLLMLLSAIVIGSLLSGVVAINSQRQLLEQRVLAQVACRNVLEELRRVDVADLVAANGRGFAVAGMGGTGAGLQPVPGDPDGLPGSIAVVPERTYGSEVLYRVTASVVWARTRGRARAELTTLLGRRR